MLPNRNYSGCRSEDFYTYDAFITAAKSFPTFATTGDTDTCKRELAAFFGQTSHETTEQRGGEEEREEGKGGGPDRGGEGKKRERKGRGGGPDSPKTRRRRSFDRRLALPPPSQVVQPSDRRLASASGLPPPPPLPPVIMAPSSPAHRRLPSPPSLSLLPIPSTPLCNYNYGQAGVALGLGLELLNNPDLVETDPTISFKTALWFWMATQSPKPSCHDVIIGNLTPTPADQLAGRVPGYGVITNIINGGLQCGRGPDSRVEDRIGFYQRYCSDEIFDVSTGDNLDCNNQAPFGTGLLLDSM
ncbi:hypothetical protein TEA_029337 [Camellia sinensis var. sinensis]|uniref:chitinase n=1 Tax=Camellia sinensis var. sinensis TaxID=542762 RepID=A0A4V3WMY0_CAMSN|nr:hypothetical protein TEA_029337 [Camellia sinensis var. sinensis]